MPPEKRTSTRKTTKPTTTGTTRRTRKKPRVPTTDQIAERAYFIHLDEGGDAFGNWLRAERELSAA
jgi:Protein of unknown function (DUF2934)